ncbi:hypothetical protein PHYBOEH_003599 [Phytophthora boehmeriae]|uniref:FMP27 C-terminal domain-containing protein n=1 Tax=Phytophthora boehmeriae TaxID=109152 RepID=A0A8T1XB59_9STRA|nr:hypothetical protein PHYBOEH_003599 [Phytophthora boehmeriae]
MSSASVSSIMTNISMLGSTATHHYADENSTDELQSLTQQFESLYQLTRLLATEVQKQAQKNSLPNVDIEFTLDRASLMLSGETAGIVRAQVSSLSFQMQLFEDRSGKFALTLQDLSANNLNPGTPYPDLLVPAYSRSWEGDDMFLRIDAEIAKPVGNITVVQHFEVNVHPIQVCITQEVIMQLIGFFSPSTKLNGTKEEQREEVRSQFLQARTASGSSSDGRVGSAILKVVKGAGKAAAHPLSRGRTHRGDSDEEAASSFRKSKAGTLHNIAEDPSQWIAKLAASLSESEEASNIFGSPDELEQHVTFDPKSRAKNSILFKRIRLGAVEVLLTYKHKKSSTSTQHLHLPHAAQPQALEDMRGFEVKTRALVYCDKTCSPLDLLLRIRRDIVLDVLSQVGRNFTNIGNFLRDQFEPSRWAAFDALAPLKSLSTTVSSLGIGSSHTGAVVPLPTPPESESETPTKNSERHSSGSISTNVKPTESPYSSPRWEPPAHLVVSPRDQSSDSSAPSTPADASLAATHRPHSKPKLSLARMFSRRKSSSNPSPPPSQ